MIGIFPLLIGFGFFAFCIFIQNSWFTNLTYSFQSIHALNYAAEIFVIVISIMRDDWLIGQIYMYALLILMIIILQNIFLIIIGDGYVKSKYFHKNNWVKAGDNAVFDDKKNTEDPLECFEEHNEKAEKTNRALVKMLKADKEFLLTEYYASRGIKYNPNLYDDNAREKSPEELFRQFEHHMKRVVEEYEKIIESIDDDLTLPAEEAQKEKEILLKKLNVVMEAMEYKVDKISKNMMYF